MADQVIEQIREVAEGQIDFEGQQLCKQLSTISLSAAGLLAVVVGFITQDIKLAIRIGLGATAATFFLTIPPWPFYNKNPLKWLPVGGTPVSVASQSQRVVLDTATL